MAFLESLIGAGASARNTDKVNETNRQIADATNQANERMNQANIDYQNALNQQIFAREDTSYQRTVNDMIKAGLSPSMMSSTNGAGGTVSAPANTFGAVGYEAQRNNVGEILAQSDGILNTIAKGVEIQNMKAEGEYIKAQTEHLNPAQRFLDYLNVLAESTDPNSSQRKNLDKVMDYVKNFISENNLFSKLGYGDKFNDFLTNPDKFITDLYESAKGKSSEFIENTGKVVGDTVSNVVGGVVNGLSESSLGDGIKTFVDNGKKEIDSISAGINKKAENKKKAEGDKKKQKEIDKRKKKNSKLLNFRWYKPSTWF